MPDLSDHWLLDALADGVIVIDAAWRVQFANRAAERLLHQRRERLIGKVIGEEVPEPRAERMAVYREVMRDRKVRLLREVQLEGPEVEGRIFEGEVHPSPAGGIVIVFRDVTEQRKAEQAATRLGRILEGSWNEIYICSADTLRFLQVSKGALQNLGYSMEELSGLTPLDLAPEYRREELERFLILLQNGERAHLVFETVHRRKDGSHYPVEVRLQRAGGEVEPVLIGMVLDITERRRAQELLEAQAQELEDALEARNRFYAAMSHELRTPLNAVIGYNDLILSGIYGEVSEKARAGIERSQRAARHLLEIVNDVLSISRLEAGKVEVRPEEVEVRELMEDLLATTKPLAEKYGSELRLSMEDCSFPVTTDPRRLRQILLNLISNAAKFGEGEPVDLRCTGTPDGGIELAVRDRGSGIAPEDQERVFDEFVQLKPGDDATGTGLGLPIAKRLAELLGGRLLLDSTPGEGSTFRLILPGAFPPPRSTPS
jgi:PAS domain S-box-containing protein